MTTAESAPSAPISADDVAGQRFGVVVLDGRRGRRAARAADVGRRAAIARRAERRELMAPRVCELREPVDEDDELAVRRAREQDAHVEISRP